MSSCDWIVEGFSFLALLAVCYPLLFLNQLAGIEIPVHYTISGKIDSWGDRYFLWVLPLIALFFYIILSLLGKYPKKLNYPVKVTARNSASLYRLGTNLLRHVKLFVLLILAYINNTTYLIAIGKEDKLNEVMVIVLLCGFFITIIFFVLKMIKLKNDANSHF